MVTWLSLSYAKIPRTTSKSLFCRITKPKKLCWTCVHLLRLERLLCVHKFHGIRTKSDKLGDSDRKLKEDGGCWNLIPTWLSSNWAKSNGVNNHIYITRHDRHFTLNRFRITAVISESYSVLVNACLISRTAMNYLRICTSPLSQTK